MSTLHKMENVFQIGSLCVYITYIALEAKRMCVWVGSVEERGKWGKGDDIRCIELCSKTNVNQCLRTTQPARFTGAFIYTRIYIGHPADHAQGISDSEPLILANPSGASTKNFPSRSIKRGLGEKLGPRDTCSVNRYALNMNVHDSRLNT